MRSKVQKFYEVFICNFAVVSAGIEYACSIKCLETFSVDPCLLGASLVSVSIVIDRHERVY